MTMLLPVNNLETTTGHERHYKHLLSDELWGRMTRRIAKENEVELNFAERIMDQALAFMLLCGNPTMLRGWRLKLRRFLRFLGWKSRTDAEPYSPSDIVDIGWHTFILYTKPYEDWCKKTLGYVLHHYPSDEEGVDYGSDGVIATVIALKRHSLFVDEELWPNDKSAECGPHGPSGSCSGHWPKPRCKQAA